MPDLNSVPPSPHVLAASRQSSSSQNGPSQTQHPSASTSPSLNILPSNQQALQQASASSLPSPSHFHAAAVSTGMPPLAAPGQDNTGVGSGPGPLRHPRPLTAAELHSQLEQEQEMLVNRLTRDLSMLRAAQNSSVASNASSASVATSADQIHSSSFTDTHLLSGPGFPLSSTSADRRHHRTSSSTSARSTNQGITQGSGPSPIPIPQSHSASAASVLEAARNPRGAPGMSRQNSTASHRSRSRNHSPQPFGHSSYTQSHGFPYDYGSSSYFPRGYASSNQSVVATPGSELSPGIMPATLRYEETAHFRQELETAKRENDALKKRVRELERMLRDRSSRDVSDVGSLGRGRSGSTSTSTTASASNINIGAGGGGASIAGNRRGVERTSSGMSFAGSVGVGVPEEDLRVGESAASTGIRTGQAQEMK
ncbi:hypothetical protein F4775DRAFT_577340 [Biscogniauxia sp. FL1348]|nr:hypothetical protein F4775DRAFT_577340 [Biscogniauxia sp. FL1348]